MTMYQYPDYMYHHGVKGMKWGVRKKYQISGTQNNRQAKKAYKTDKRSTNKNSTSKKIKTGLKVAAGVGVTIAAAYGAHKLGNLMIQKEYQAARAYGESYAQGLLKTNPNLATPNLATPNLATTALKTPSVKKALHI